MSKGKVIVMTNMKGGIGKTTDNDLLAVIASQIFHKKVLLVDYDQQSNSTSNMTSTYQITDYNKSLAIAIESGDWLSSITKLSPNLDFIAGSLASKELNDWVIEKYTNNRKRNLIFKETFEKLKDKYDYVFIDCPPSTDHVVDAFLTSADYVIPLQELKRFAMEGTRNFIDNVLVPIRDEFEEESNVQIIGILPVLFSARRKTQQINLRELRKEYGIDNIFSTIIKGSDRIEQYGEDGITLDDYIDRRMWAIFCDIFTELEKRIEFYERTGDTEGFSYTPIYSDSLSARTKTLKKGKELKIDGIVKF